MAMAAAALVPYIPLAQQLIQALMNGISFKKSNDDPDITTELRNKLAAYEKNHAELLENFAKLTKQLKQKKIDSFEELSQHDRQAKKVFVELAQKTEATHMDGNNIGLFGLTSTGKSTMLNALLGQNLAETGVGETTTKITPYNGRDYTLWDIPGRNDEISYLSMEYVGFFKGLTRRLILIQATVKENSSLMKLLDELGLHYDIVFNKFDKVDEEAEQIQIPTKIRLEVQQLDLKHVNKIYFVSAKNPKMFADWLAMVNDLTKKISQ